MSATTAVSMKARPYLHYAPVPDGVYISGPGAQFVLRGPALLFRVADVCVPLMEAGTTEDELVSALGSEKARPVVRKLVSELRSRDLMLDLDALTAPEPSAEVRERHTEALTHLEAATDDPYAVFERLRGLSVLLCGPAAAILPAARGLHRSGITRLTLAASEADAASDAVTAIAERLGLAQAPFPAGGQDTAPLPEGLDAVLYCLDGPGAEPPAALAAGLPEGLPVVPVWRHELVVTAGPALHGAEGWRRPAELAARASRWAEAEELDEPPQPTGWALAGALGGQLLFETLAGIAVSGSAHVVYGGDLATESVTLPATPGTAAAAGGSGASVLTASAEDLDTSGPTPEEALAEAVRLTARWTGPFAQPPGLDLPQLPLSLRETVDRAGSFGTLTSWADEQRTATVAGVLAALRERPAAGVAAAGLTEEQWLLDGALRLLAPQATAYASRIVGDERPETRRLTRALEDEGGKLGTVELLRLDGVDWRLARVTAQGGAREFTAQCWAPDEDAAVQRALATVLADAQVAALDGGAATPGGVHTDALLQLDEEGRTALRRQIAEHGSRRGVRYRGTLREPDAVLGVRVLWAGGVEAVPTAEADA